MLRPFNHPYLRTVRWEWIPNHNGGMSLHTMIVVPNLPMDPTKGDFDQAKLEELGTAAVMYAKDHGSAFLVKLETA